MYACMLSFSVMSDSVTPWTVAHLALLSMEFSRQEYWSGLPFPPLGDLPDPGIKPTPPVSLELVGRFFTTVLAGKPCRHVGAQIKGECTVRQGSPGGAVAKNRPANQKMQEMWVSSLGQKYHLE